uniref:Adenylate cyclase n=1 Tax=Kwoniella bestiolae CBS 10118 TaxID=1296100 RepID=A0A1B9FVM5_9TREE|nr:adenylate cyclase [Kwoniella bestiolae CBS 10118]OCF22829.1 adenylate cyclase [Kwoniella bestiolae CBS 10118]
MSNPNPNPVIHESPASTYSAQLGQPISTSKHRHSQDSQIDYDPSNPHPHDSPEKKRRHLDDPSINELSRIKSSQSSTPRPSSSVGQSKKHSPRARNGSSSARMEDSEKRRSRTLKEQNVFSSSPAASPNIGTETVVIQGEDEDGEFEDLEDDEDGRRDSILDPPLPSRNLGKVSPLAKRLGEEPPFMLPHPSRNTQTSQTYPGVVMGSFAGGGGNTFGEGFEGGMDDILDPDANANNQGRHGSTSVNPSTSQAAPNIAPWLMDDSSPSSASSSTTAIPQLPPPEIERSTSGRGPAATLREKDSSSRKASNVLNHFSSVPSLPKIRRQPTTPVEVPNEMGPSSRNTSHTSISTQILQQTPLASSGSSIIEGGSRQRTSSNDSLQTLSANQRSNRDNSPKFDTATNQSSSSQSNKSHGTTRVGRFGSTASSTSGSGGQGNEKKKGFLGGLLKRRTGPSISLGTVPDFQPPETINRGSAGSTSSRISNSPSITSMISANYGGLSPGDRGPSDSYGRNFRQGSNYISEGAISPLQEIAETPFHLDMNLDDMEGIVDPTKSGVQPTFARPPTTTHNSGTTATTDSNAGSMSMEDALAQTSSFATTVSGGESSGSNGSSGQPPPTGRNVVGEAERVSGPFVRNPFSTGSSVGSLDANKPATPPSPHTLSPRHALPPTTQPRRPSQLRNMKMGSIDSDNSEPVEGSAWQNPIAPSWAAGGSSSHTVFNDPFGSARSLPPISDDGPAGAIPESRKPSESTTAEMTASISALPSHMATSAAAWAAPESWGVEGDEEESDGQSSSSESEGNDQWEGDTSNVTATANGRSSGGVENLRSPSTTSSGPRSPTLSPTGAKKPPPFGFKSSQSGSKSRTSSGRPSTGQGGKRGKTASGRPSTAAKSKDGRPGTSGSVHAAAAVHWIRIYRSDGSYTVHHLPITTSTAEFISMLSGQNEAPPGKKITTSMKLYLRERGQDRLLLPSEKPIAIQHRRLLQAGYTEAEHPEEIGKDDMGILCRFIYQTPALPIMNPEEESSYDSFEFIDVARRDLQTIPIFLHLHAHNIIILNVSANPMTDIPLDFIQACTGLKELRMSNMALKRVPNNIRASTTLARLDVSCNRISELESVPLNEVETLVSLKVQNNKLTSMPSYFAQMKALKYLNISNNKFETFPSVVCEMSNLVDLDLSFNNITELPSKMSDLKSLERLALFSNELTSFPPSFSTLLNLRILDVRRNKLTDLTAVYALPNLATLQADYNNIVTLDAQIGANVRQFSVPHNSITRFTLAPQPNMAMVTYNLTNLDLSHGKISTLADEAFSGLINLVKLNLNFNQFTRLPSTLDRLKNLEVFSCTDNMLNDLPIGLGKLQKLRILNLHNNNLKNLRSELWGCGSLETLNCSSNLLEGFEPLPEDWEAVTGLPASELPQTSGGPLPIAMSARHLYLGDNRITDEIFHYVASLPYIKTVNLSFNDIYEIPPDTIGHCSKLESLYLSGNKLTSLPAEDLEKLVSLKTLHLNGNKLQTLPSELGAIKSLQHLDVGSNVLKYNIANWPYDWNWNWNTALRYLNLSGNKRLEIKPTSAQEMNHASSFRKELSDFTALTQLRVLGLMDVTLRIPSLPDESDQKRVRTSFSDINNMAYGISDMLGTNEHLAMFDLVVPNFRGKGDECLFGMFGGTNLSFHGGRFPKMLQDLFAGQLVHHLGKLAKEEDLGDALRKTFLYVNRRLFESCFASGQTRKGSAQSMASIDDMFRGWAPAVGSLYRTGSSGAVVYLSGKTLHVGNVGDILVVVSRKGEAELLSKKHDPTDREETARIRRAEAWVSTKGFVNDDKDISISRAFGFYHNFPAINTSPEIRTRPLTEQDEFVIIGNNALWSRCSYQTAVDIARTEKDDPMMAAQKLRDFAISYGADGSVMVMVVNISDLFFGQSGHRPRGMPGSNLPSGAADASAGETDGNWVSQSANSNAVAKRPITRRREEVGDRTLNRLQREIEPPTGQIAIVFTDIVNSTHLWETNPGMPTSIKIHHNFMRRQLRLDGGYEVKTEGDSFMVSFQSVTAALLWCFNCQIGLLSQEWPRELLEANDGKVVYDSNGSLIQRGLRVRMGVHWGSPECERDPITRRMDYYGPMVNRAARINASADGGQLMASGDVINEITAVREYLETNDEEALNELQGDIKREILELRRIGLDIKDMGERKLKGLEVPEKLHLLYPKTLSGRLEMSNDLRAEVEVNDARKTEQRMIDLEQVKDLSLITLRLEAICNLELGGMAGTSTVSKRGTANSGVLTLPVPNLSLGPTIREDMNDDELMLIIESLTGRCENALSTLYLKQLGGFSTVMASLEKATKIDSKLITHALSLMNGAFGG